MHVRLLRPRLLALAVVVAGLAAAPSGAAAQGGERTVESVSSGDVTAELSYERIRRGSGPTAFFEYRDFRVRIERAGVVAHDRAVRGPCERFCVPTKSALTGEAIGLRDLNADGELEAVVGLFTGGANCCVLVLAHGYDAASSRYRRVTLDTGGGYVARDPDGDGAVELVGDDFRFRGAFTCGACGARPLRIWAYDGASFDVVTKSFRARIRAHAQRMRRLYRRARRLDDPAFVKGALTPYVADLCMLGRCGRGFRLVRAALRRGELDRQTPFDVSPLGRNYLTALKRFLRRTGYRG